MDAILKYKKYIIEGKKEQIWWAVYLALSGSLLFSPLSEKSLRVENFKRVIGAGIIDNVDVARRIQNFNTWFLLFAVLFLAFYGLSGFILAKANEAEQNRMLDFIDHFLVIANLNVILIGIQYFQNTGSDEKVFPYSGMLCLGIFVSAVFYLVSGLNRYIELDEFAAIWMLAAGGSYPIVAVWNIGWREGKTLYATQIITVSLLFLMTFLIKRNTKFHDKIKNIYTIFAVYAGILPFILSFYIEMINILNQYEVYVVKVRRYFIVLTLIGTGVCALLAWKTRITKSYAWKRISYPFFVFGISCLSVQIPLESVYNAEIYESANYSVLISDFLNFGSIPLVEHYGGHMMQGVWEGILYALFNHDISGAIFSPYSIYLKPLLCVLFYFFMRNIWNQEMALIATLVIPFYSGWNYYGLGMLICLAVMAFIKKETYFRAWVIWFAVVWCALYRLDLGAAFGVATVIALIIYMIQKRQWSSIKKLFAMLICWIIFGCILWIVLCKIKGINAFERLDEFLMISFSNANWAYTGIGATNTLAFSWCYLFLPFLCIICILCLLVLTRYKERLSQSQWIILLIMGISYFANFSRSIVRHSLEEDATTSVIVWTSYLFLASFFGVCFRNKKIILVLYMGLIIISSALIDGKCFTEESIISAEIAKTGEFLDSWKNPSEQENGISYWQKVAQKGEPVQRVIWDENLNAEIIPYKVITDVLLEPNETFIDFINKTFLYSALGRQTPFYVSQSPMQISGEKAQELFIEEIQGTPLVLMPVEANEWDHSDSTDGIANVYRYYKISEYIYQNYRPLCKYDNKFTVWCTLDNYNKYEKKIEDLLKKNISETADITSSITIIGYGYDGPAETEDGTYSYTGKFHNYAIRQLPQIWAEFDEKNAAENDEISSLTKSGNIYTFNNIEDNKKQGNYLLIRLTSGAESGNITVTLGTNRGDGFAERYRYLITTSEGTHDYLIRVSTDYYWYTDSVNAVSVQSDVELSDVSMSILAGD